MARPVTVIVDTIYRKAPEIFDGMDFSELKVVPAVEDEIAAAVEGSGAFAVILDAQAYQGALYDKMPEGGLLARFGVGYDGIDFVRAGQRKLVVTNTPDVLETTVAESTVFLAAEVLRRMGTANKDLKGGIWKTFLGEDLGGKTWAIIGLGRIGTALSRMLTFGFGVRVYGVKSDLSDSERLKERSGAVLITDRFEQVASQSDIVSLHLPVTPSTRHFMDQNKLGQLKQGAVLINTGRGSLVDEIALYDAVTEGRLAGVGLDVFEYEPYRPVNPEKDLRTLDKAVLTPHISSSTHQCAVRMARRVIDNIGYALKNDYGRMDIVNP